MMVKLIQEAKACPCEALEALEVVTASVVLTAYSESDMLRKKVVALFAMNILRAIAATLETEVEERQGQPLH